MKTVGQMLDLAFAPDIRVVVSADSVVVSADAVSGLGRKWLAGRSVAGLDYDLAFRPAAGLTIESVEGVAA